MMRGFCVLAFCAANYKRGLCNAHIPFRMYLGCISAQVMALQENNLLLQCFLVDVRYQQRNKGKDVAEKPLNTYQPHLKYPLFT